MSRGARSPRAARRTHHTPRPPQAQRRRAQPDAAVRTPLLNTNRPDHAARPEPPGVGSRTTPKPKPHSGTHARPRPCVHHYPLPEPRAPSPPQARPEIEHEHEHGARATAKTPPTREPWCAEPPRCSSDALHEDDADAAPHPGRPRRAR
ncbi:hypothetical protein B0H17DRAFT_535586 [Mycena rosella]|uniref:Uncharacterized protein n=1 Tax=Mycena rosella TaxID=1033263 RepID=A0AAD7BV81_MYCRO|nr:hypothetical protein B0H17DRAFT_535586 [Mycena rosella]